MAAQQFAYTVLDRTGKELTGRITADSEAAVRARLLGMGMTVLEIKIARSGLRREIDLGLNRRVKTKDLAVFVRQFATMNNAGVSLPRTLHVLAEQAENPELRKTVHRVRIDVESGARLHDAMAKHPRVFPALMVNMAKAADVGGLLGDTLRQIADTLEADNRLRGRIKSAMTYPVIVLIIAVLMVIGMLTFVVPVFEGIFKQMGGQLPVITQILVSVSHSMIVTGPLLLIAGLAGGYAWRRYRNDPVVRGVLDPLKLRVPIFGMLTRKIAVARFTRNFGSLLNAGVPILQALDIVAETSGSTVIADAVRQAQEKVRGGAKIDEALGEHAVFPPMVIAMAAVGDEAGQTGNMLLRIAESYDEDVDNTTQTLTNLLNPLMMVGLGVIIFFIVMALYLPMFSIYDLIK